MSEAADDSRITVLVVDDDKAFCQALAGALRRRGLAVVVAHNYDDALAEAEAWSPDRAVVDLRMPGRSGLELVAALRRSDPHMGIVVLTGYGSIASAIEAIVDSIPEKEHKFPGSYLCRATCGLKACHAELQASIDVIVEAQPFEQPLRDELSRRDIEQIPVRARFERVPKRGAVGEAIAPIGDGQLDIDAVTTAACFDVLDVTRKPTSFSAAIDRWMSRIDAHLLPEP